MEKLLWKIKSRHDNLATKETGFSLLEIVVAVSIMLILGVVGTVSYQAYTDNARTAAAEASASEVLTSVLASDDSPNQDPGEAIADYNASSRDMAANIHVASNEELIISTTDTDEHQGFATIKGDYRHLDTTNYTVGVSHQWVGEPNNSQSIKLKDGVEVSRNLVTDPRIVNSRTWGALLNIPVWGGWENGAGVELQWNDGYKYDDDGEILESDGTFRAGIQSTVGRPIEGGDYTVSFDAQRVADGGTVRVLLWEDNEITSTIKSLNVTQERERYVVHLTRDRPWERVYIDFMRNETPQPGETIGYLDRVLVEEGHTDGEYFDGDSH